jgi:hypothetical protein
VKKKKRWKTGRLHWPGSHHRHHHDEHEQNNAERLTPLEETEGFAQSHQAEGEHTPDDTIHVDSASIRMPEHLVEDEREGARIFWLETVVVVILTFMLAFIAFIAWQITLMPEKRDDPSAASDRP